VSAVTVEPAFDVVEERHSRRGAGQEDLAVEQFAVERRPEALGERVVVGVAPATHRRRDTRLAEPSAESQAGVLHALVGVVDDVDRLPPPKRHLERVEHDLAVCRLSAIDQPTTARLKTSQMLAR
jgi:hypothetical protein